MNHALKFTQEKLEKRIQLLETFRFIQKEPIPQFRCQLLDAPCINLENVDLSNLSEPYPVKAGDYWVGQRQDFLLEACVDTPFIAEPQLALYLPLGDMGDIFNHPEALVRVNSEIVGSADRHHHLLRLPEALTHESALNIQMLGWSGLTGWPIDSLNTSKLQIANGAVRNCNITRVAGGVAGTGCNHTAGNTISGL